MPNSTVSQIELPNGTIYDIEDSTARQIEITATYTAATLDLALDLSGVQDADDDDF